MNIMLTNLGSAQVELYSSFRPGDLVRAQVVSLGDSRSYFLSTASNDCGVVYAKSTSGELLQPLRPTACRYIEIKGTLGLQGFIQ